MESRVKSVCLSSVKFGTSEKHRWNTSCSRDMKGFIPVQHTLVVLVNTLVYISVVFTGNVLGTYTRIKTVKLDEMSYICQKSMAGICNVIH